MWHARKSSIAALAVLSLVILLVMHTRSPDESRQARLPREVAIEARNSPSEYSTPLPVLSKEHMDALSDHVAAKLLKLQRQQPTPPSAVKGHPEQSKLVSVPQVSACEHIDVAVAAFGDTSVWNLQTMLKGLLLRTKHRLRLHVITDPQTQRSILPLFQSWAIPGLQVMTYVPTRAMTEVLASVPTNHYAVSPTYDHEFVNMLLVHICMLWGHDIVSNTVAGGSCIDETTPDGSVAT